MRLTATAAAACLLVLFLFHGLGRRAPMPLDRSTISSEVVASEAPARVPPRIAREFAASENALPAGTGSGLVTFVEVGTNQPVVGRTFELVDGVGEAAHAVSDGEGTISIGPGRFGIHGWEKEFGAVMPSVVDAAPRTRTFVYLAPDLDLRVHVIDELGAPIVNADLEWGLGRWVSANGGATSRESTSWRAKTDALGGALLRNAPIEWMGRLHVNKQGYFPFQQTIPSTPEVSAGAMELTVVLTAAPAQRGLGLLCMDSSGVHFEGVTLQALLFDRSWPQAEAISLPVSGADGCIALDDWVADVHRLDLGGTAHPSTLSPSEVRWREHGFTPLVLHRSAAGLFVGPGLEPGQPIAVIIQIGTAIDDSLFGALQAALESPTRTVEPTSTPFARPCGDNRRVDVGPDGTLQAVVPAGVDVRATLVDGSGNSWRGTFRASGDGWIQEVDLTGTSGSEEFVVVPHGAILHSVTANFANTLSPLGITNGSATPGAMTVLGPRTIRSMRLACVDGRSAILSRRCEGNDRVLNVVFPEHHDVTVAVRDSYGGVNRDVYVSLDSMEPLRRIGACWSSSGRTHFGGIPDQNGEIELSLPSGRYQVRAIPLPWREGLTFGDAVIQPAGGFVQIVGSDAIDVIVRGARRLTVELRTGGTRRLPPRWSLRDASSGETVVFQGTSTELWVTTAEHRLEVLDPSQEVIGQFDVPEGRDPWRALVQL